MAGAGAGAAVASAVGGGAGKEAVKQAGEVQKKIIDNEAQRAKFRKEIDIAKVNRDIEITKVRQKEFSKRNEIQSKNWQVYRNTSDEIVNSFDKPYIWIESPKRKKRGKVNIELSMIAMSQILSIFGSPIARYIARAHNTNNPGDQNISTLFNEMDIQMQNWDLYFKRLTETYADTFKKTVAAGSYFNPPLDPDVSTDSGGLPSWGGGDYGLDELEESDTPAEKEDKIKSDNNIIDALMMGTYDAGKQVYDKMKTYVDGQITNSWKEITKLLKGGA